MQRNTMRLSFGVQTCQRIHDGMAALSRAVGSVVKIGATGTKRTEEVGGPFR